MEGNKRIAAAIEREDALAIQIFFNDSDSWVFCSKLFERFPPGIRLSWRKRLDDQANGRRGRVERARLGEGDLKGLCIGNADRNATHSTSCLDSSKRSCIRSNRDSLGQQLAMPFLSITDNALNPANIGAPLFDGEGTPTAPLTLVEGGVLRHFLHSEATARAFGVAPTGHAGMGAKVSVAPDWFEIGPAPGQAAGEEGLDRFASGGRRAGEGSLVVIDSLSALHAGVKASQGAFSLPFDGWLVRDGETISIESATVAGDIRSVLMQLVGFEGPGKVTPSGLCPWVWVDGLTITGDA
jgi:hypothetical protein